MFDALKPFIARWIAAPVAALCAYLAVHLGVVTTAQDQSAIIAVALLVAQVIYATVHSFIEHVIGKASGTPGSGTSGTGALSGGASGGGASSGPTSVAPSAKYSAG